MRFASVLHDGKPLAVAIDDDRGVPLRGIRSWGLGRRSICSATHL